MMSQAEQQTRQRIVVGVDGSEESRVALRWAAEEAKVHDADVEAVLAFQSTQLLGAIAPHPGVPMPVVMGEPDTDAAQAEKTLAEILEEVAADLPPARLTPLAIEGKPATVLLAQAADADLLVVGSRGSGGLKSLLLGSVAEQCVRHASCMVAVVKAGESGLS